MIAARDSPAPFFPGRIRLKTFVKTCTSSRGAISLRRVPVISSLLAAEYTFAVSKVVIPRSYARRTKWRASSMPTLQGWAPRSGSPYDIMPRRRR